MPSEQDWYSTLLDGKLEKSDRGLVMVFVGYVNTKKEVTFYDTTNAPESDYQPAAHARRDGCGTTQVTRPMPGRGCVEVFRVMYVTEYSPIEQRQDRVGLTDYLTLQEEKYVLLPRLASGITTSQPQEPHVRAGKSRALSNI